jgi:hypothetical protein
MKEPLYTAVYAWVAILTYCPLPWTVGRVWRCVAEVTEVVAPETRWF